VIDEGEVLPGEGGSSIRLGKGIPRSSRAGGGVKGVDPKEGGGVSSSGDRFCGVGFSEAASCLFFPDWISPGRRVQDLAEIEGLLSMIGEELGYTISKKKAPGRVIHLQWIKNGSLDCSFLISASGLLSKILEEITNSAERRWIILPGSRAGLIHYKLEHNPPLAEIIDQGWGLVKFRHIRRLAEVRGPDFLDRLDLDPFQSDSPQLPLI